MYFGALTLLLLSVSSCLGHRIDVSVVKRAVEVSTGGHIGLTHDEAENEKGEAEAKGCGPVVSFIISINSEMVKLTGGHLLSMFVDALHPDNTGHAGLSFKEDYVRSLEFSKECPEGSTPIKDETECRDAGAELGYKWKSKLSKKTKPPNCFGNAEDGKVYFNQKSDTNQQPYHFAICKKNAPAAPANLSRIVDPVEVVDPEQDEKNWGKVRDALAERNVNVVIFACQECGSSWLGKVIDKKTGRADDSSLFQHTPLALLADERRLGKDFSILGMEQFYTVTKSPSMLKATTHSMMFIGGMKKSTFCPDIVVEKEIMSPGPTSNKGAVVLYLTTPEKTKIAYAGTHLDAKDPDIRLSNIRLISAGLQASGADSWFVFGDLNYRLTAPLYDRFEQEKCRACLTKKEHIWCHDFNDIALEYDIACVPPPSECVEGLMKTSGAASNCARTKSKADFDFYFTDMFLSHEDRGHEPNNLYNDLAKYDTLHYHLDDWIGFWKPDFSANVLPTYTIKIPGLQYYELQKIFEAGSTLGAAGSTLAKKEALRWLASDAYKTSKDDLKKCETVESPSAFPDSPDAPKSGKCLNLGWLDRLMIGGPNEDAEGDGARGLTKVNEYRTLKIHPPLYGGDHVPLYMLLTTAN